MYKLIKKYHLYITLLVFIYIFTNIIKSIFNIYTLILLISILIYVYINNRRLFKKIIYKLLYRNRPIRIGSKFSAAKKSLKSLEEIKKEVGDKVKAKLINYESRKIQNKLQSGNYNVILFGAGSCGKTSIAKSLVNNIVGKTSPLTGTTKKFITYKINIPFLKRKINIIDTPGLFEASIDGEKREKQTISKATKSDLIIFVIDQDLNKYELYLLEQLSRIGKELIISLNKCDLRTEEQNNIIRNNIYKLVNKFRNNPKIILTAASPQSKTRNRNREKSGVRNVDNLFTEIIDILDKNGEELLADNILFQCNKLGTISKSIIYEQRKKAAKQIITKYSWITSGVILITPLPAIDLIAASTINIQMILEISRIFGYEISRKEALELARSMISVLATMGIVKGGMNIISHFLSVNFTTIFISKSLQSITAAWIIKVAGLSFIKYFQQNQSWGDGGIQDVVQEFYEINRREDYMKEFIREAVNRIKSRNFSKYKKLPPYSQKD